MRRLWAFFVTMFIYRDSAGAIADARPSDAEDRRDGDDADRLRVGFGYVMALMQTPGQDHGVLPDDVAQQASHPDDDQHLLLVLGCLMDLAPLLLICTPIMLPVVSTFGVDPVHFGMIMLLNLGIGLLTPPVGATLFVGCAVGKVSMEEVMRGIWPFYGVMLAVLMLVTYVPAISLWLPRLLGL